MQDLITITGTTRDERRAQIMALQEFMDYVAAESGDVPTPVQHHFAPGMYAREMHIPAGTLIMGKIHRHEHLSMLVAGTLRIVDEDGDRTLTGPHMFVSKVGAKNVGHAITDVVFTTFHATDITDIAQLEAWLSVPDYAALELEATP